MPNQRGNSKAYLINPVIRSLFVLIPVVMTTTFACRSGEGEINLPLDYVAEGDLAFRCGRGILSRAVTSAEDDGVYSHVGLVVQDGDSWKVVHAVPGERENTRDFARVKVEDIRIFFSGKHAVRGCLAHTGYSDSSFVHALCCRAIQSALDSIRFDSDYNLADTSKVYCTEFVWRLYENYGVDLSEGRRRYVNVFNIKGELILPEHILRYSGNNIYFSY